MRCCCCRKVEQNVGVTDENTKTAVGLCEHMLENTPVSYHIRVHAKDVQVELTLCWRCRVYPCAQQYTMKTRDRENRQRERENGILQEGAVTTSREKVTEGARRKIAATSPEYRK